MNKIQHSKYKNSGLIFEILIRQISSDTLKGVDSPAIDIVKKYFIKSELGREYKLYDSIMKSKSLTEGKANILIDSILQSSERFNRKQLKSAKYNLIKEISDNYNLDEFFNTKIKNYKELASVYTLIEAHNSKEMIDSNQVANNKFTLLEYLTIQPSENVEIINESIEEFKKEDKDVRMLTYKILLEKFNSKYDGLSKEQKLILKEFINSLDSTPQLKTFYNSKIVEIKGQLVKEIKSVKDQATKIKLQEVVKYLTELNKNDKINNEYLVDLLQYCDLITEVKSINGTVQI